ncbi:hypothetical protein CES87_22480 [Pseudomonas sp. ERMR1:02]|nr:hypothetical protein CES87_22480 [Pseudomonas sp. ERMR1:02]
MVGSPGKRAMLADMSEWGQCWGEGIHCVLSDLYWHFGPLRGQASLLQEITIPVGARLAREEASAAGLIID